MASTGVHLPFPLSQQLCDDLDAASLANNGLCLPGQPCVSLADTNGLAHFLEQEYIAQELEGASSRLYILTTQSSCNINPLHKQKIKGRDICTTEDPRLHLVWINDRIFIKPLPIYLLSFQFWETYLVSNKSPLGERRHQIRKAALGYLRTYYHLIRHESDLRIAQKEQLVPTNVGWENLCHLTKQLSRIQDTEVSGRYQYGEMRLSRLNLYAPLLFQRYYYEQVHAQYGPYFARLYGPILFIFAIMSTLLNAMQVAIGAEVVEQSTRILLRAAFYWFSIATLLVTTTIAAFFALLWIWMVADEWVYVVKCKREKRRARSKTTIA